jgi:hypothetical protein
MLFFASSLETHIFMSVSYERITRMVINRHLDLKSIHEVSAFYSCWLLVAMVMTFTRE